MEKEKTHTHTIIENQLVFCRFFLLLRKEKNVLSAPTVDGFFFVFFLKILLAISLTASPHRNFDRLVLIPTKV